MSGVVPPVIALGHDATRTGAPLVLLHLMDWATRHRRAEFDLVLRRGGELEPAFAQIARTTTTLRPWGRRSAADVVESALTEMGATALARRVPEVEARFRRAVRRAEPTRAIVNGMGGAALLGAVPEEVPISVLVHELDIGMHRSAGEEHRRRLWRRAERVVAVSDAVADMLRTEPEVDAASIRVAHAFVPDRPISDQSAIEQRRALGLAHPEHPLVGSVGTGQWRKGIDMLAPLARRLTQTAGQPVHLAWVGPIDDETQLRHDLRAAGVEEFVTLVGAVEDAAPWFGAFDVVVSMAREDPFPLVGLEAGLAGCPVVSFANGGLEELLADDRGVIVAPLDVEAMAAAVTELLQDRDRAAATGVRLQHHVRSRHVLERGAPVMWSALVGEER